MSGHHHGHGHSHGDHAHGGHAHGRAGASRAIRNALIVTLAFMAIEAVGGWIAGSLALLSDAAHMATDAGALMLSLAAAWIALRPGDEKMSFGYHRAEILGALASGLLIWILSGALIYEAILRLGSPHEVNAPLMMIIAGVGLIANLVSMRFLHGTHADQMNVRAAYLHVLADCLGSAGALVAGAIIWKTGWLPIDPLVTILFSAIMLWNTWSLIRESIHILMESTPAGVDSKKVHAALSGLAGVSEVHDLHIWTVTTGRLALSAHLVAIDAHATLDEANRLLEADFRINHTTLQIEHPEKFRSERCYDCSH